MELVLFGIAFVRSFGARIAEAECLAAKWDQVARGCPRWPATGANEAANIAAINRAFVRSHNASRAGWRWEEKRKVAEAALAALVGALPWGSHLHGRVFKTCRSVDFGLGGSTQTIFVDGRLAATIEFRTRWNHEFRRTDTFVQSVSVLTLAQGEALRQAQRAQARKDTKEYETALQGVASALVRTSVSLDTEMRTLSAETLGAFGLEYRCGQMGGTLALRGGRPVSARGALKAARMEDEVLPCGCGICSPGAATNPY